MKHWLYSIAPTIIIIVLIVHLDSFLGLLYLWALVLFVIVVLASYYIPYKLIEGEDCSSFYAFLCCLFYDLLKIQLLNQTNEKCGSMVE